MEQYHFHGMISSTMNGQHKVRTILQSVKRSYIIERAMYRKEGNVSTDFLDAGSADLIQRTASLTMRIHDTQVGT